MTITVYFCLGYLHAFDFWLNDCASFNPITHMAFMPCVPMMGGGQNDFVSLGHFYKGYRDNLFCC